MTSSELMIVLMCQRTLKTFRKHACLETTKQKNVQGAVFKLHVKNGDMAKNVYMGKLKSVLKGQTSLKLVRVKKKNLELKPRTNVTHIQGPREDSCWTTVRISMEGLLTDIKYLI